jgi:hypothetical protein
MRNDVRPLPNHLLPLVRRALDRGRESENRLLPNGRSEFLEWTAKAIEEFSSEHGSPDFAIVMVGGRSPLPQGEMRQTLCAH